MSNRFNPKKTWNDVFDEVIDLEEVDLKKTDQILVTVSDRAGQTFEHDMEESGAPKKKICIHVPTCTYPYQKVMGKLKYF